MSDNCSDYIGSREPPKGKVSTSVVLNSELARNYPQKTNVRIKAAFSLLYYNAYPQSIFHSPACHLILASLVTHGAFKVENNQAGKSPIPPFHFISIEMVKIEG